MQSILKHLLKDKEISISTNSLVFSNLDKTQIKFQLSFPMGLLFILHYELVTDIPLF